MTSEIRIVSGISGRYASALFDLAIEQGNLDEVESDLLALDSMIADNDDLARLVKSPVMSREDQERAMGAVLERGGAGHLVRQFVRLVSKNRRLFVLSKMVIDFQTLLADYRGQSTAYVTSAIPLKDEQRKRIQAQLAEIVGREITLSTDVDSELLGGLLVRIGSKMLDSSLRTKLQKMQTAMKEVS